MESFVASANEVTFRASRPFFFREASLRRWRAVVIHQTFQIACSHRLEPAGPEIAKKRHGHTRLVAIRVCKHDSRGIGLGFQDWTEG